MYIDNIKLFAKNEKKKKETLIQAVRIYGPDIGMDFHIDKCVMLILRKGEMIQDRRNKTIKSRKKSEPLEKKKSYKYFHICEANIIRKVEIKEKIKKEYLKRTRKLRETKLYYRNFIKEINNCTVLLVRYSGRLLKWTRG